MTRCLTQSRSALALALAKPGLAWHAVTLLSSAYVLSYLDRIVINLPIVPIQSDLSINDTHFSVLQNLAFGIFYITMALPPGMSFLAAAFSSYQKFRQRREAMALIWGQRGSV